MKVVAGILLTVSLAIGALGAASAYLVPLDQVSDDELVGRSLLAQAGDSGLKDQKGKKLPLAGSGARITAKDIHSPQVAEKISALMCLTPSVESVSTSLIAIHEAPVKPSIQISKLRESKVQYLWINEFNWRHWPGLYLFLASLVGFLASAFLVRAGSKQVLATTGHLDGMQSPEEAMTSLRAAIDSLHEKAIDRDSPDAEPKPQISEEELLDLMTEALTEIQQKHVAAFVDSRQQLVTQLGLARMAEIMDSFARAERQINRAWSAAADKVYDEAADCITAAREYLQATAEKLQPSS